MSDPLPTDGRVAQIRLEADRDEKIEQLLVAGLDHYFSEQYDEAIHVWTRALFLDRSHARARAYIDRARSALAERQRESEELLHSGVAAFERGDGDEARRLLHAAIDQGAPADEALAVLDRLNRLDTSRAATSPARSRSGPRPAAARAVAMRRSLMGPLAWVSVVAGGLVVAAVYVAAVLAPPDWRSALALQGPPRAPLGSPLAPPASLPIPRRGEMALGRARTAAASGHLHEALVLLDQVRPTDLQKPDADRLRADIQRQLLALAALPSPAAAPARAGGDPPRP